MSWIDGLGHRLRELFRPAAVDRDLEQELQDHLERERARQAASAPSDAARLAILRAGRPEIARENAADHQTGRVLSDAFRDIRYAVRTIRRSRGLAAAVVLSLGLGVGGTTAIFSVVDAVLLRPLPLPESDQLYRARIWWGDFDAALSVADYVALTESSRGVAEVGAYSYPDSGFAVAGPDGPEVLNGILVTTELPRVLRVTPSVGPGLSNDRECQALIGQDVWERRYGARPDAIGRVLTLDEKPCTIVGVMARGFHVPGVRDDEVWVRAPLDPPERRGAFFLHAIVRVPRNTTPDIVASRLTALVTPILRDRFGIKEKWRYGLRSEREVLVGDVRETLLMLQVSVALVLLIATVNVANLLIARGTVRTRELAVRASLGARRNRLVRQLLTESALLGVIGGVLGLGIAAIALDMAGAAATAVIPRMHEVRLDARLALFAVGIGAGAGLLAGIVPVIRLPWASLGAWLRDGGRTSGEGARTGRLRATLVMAEIALTLIVLTGSALLVKSLLRVQQEDPGFDSHGVLTFLLSLPEDPYGKADRAGALFAALDARLRAVPGVTAVAAASSLPPNLLAFSNNYTVEGTVPESGGKGEVADWNIVSHGFFRILHIGILEGREFNSHDIADSPRVAIVNESFVRRHYPDRHAVGRRLKPGTWDPRQPWTTIVGVARDVPYEKGVWGGTQPMVYVPYAQSLWYRSPYMVVRTAGDPAQLVGAVRTAVARADARLPLRDVATLDDIMWRSTAVPRLRGTLFAALGVFALALALTGVYGMTAYHVSRRRREMAIRLALGANGGQLVGGTLAAGLRIIVLGLTLGLAGALATARSLSSMLYRVEPRDPGVVVTAAAVVVVTAFAACLIPALSAARVDPATLLRDE